MARFFLPFLRVKVVVQPRVLVVPPPIVVVSPPPRPVKFGFWVAVFAFSGTFVAVSSGFALASQRKLLDLEFGRGKRGICKQQREVEAAKREVSRENREIEVAERQARREAREVEAAHREVARVNREIEASEREAKREKNRWWK